MQNMYKFHLINNTLQYLHQKIFFMIYLAYINKTNLNKEYLLLNEIHPNKYLYHFF